MTKIRIAYGVAMVMTAAAFLWNGTYFALDLFLFLLALFLSLKILLRLEMARLKFSVSGGLRLWSERKASYLRVQFLRAGGGHHGRRSCL